MKKIGDNTCNYYHLMAEKELLSEEHTRIMNEHIKFDSAFDLSELEKLPEINSI